MDGATLAILIPAVSGCVLGGIGLWKDRKKDTGQILNEAKDVATRAAEAAINALQAALDHSLAEVRELRTEAAAATAEHRVEILEVRHQMSQLRSDVENCEAEKSQLAERVHELEMSR